LIDRRALIAAGTVLAVSGAAAAKKGTSMYGMIGRIKAQPGKRDELAAILLEGTGKMPGCLNYVVAEDLADPDTLVVTEAWDSKESHDASLKLPQVQAAIARGRPLIAGFETLAETRPLGGAGLARG
jgi:quinol monooxygenase YgiN